MKNKNDHLNACILQVQGRYMGGQYTILGVPWNYIQRRLSTKYTWNMWYKKNHLQVRGLSFYNEKKKKMYKNIDTKSIKSYKYTRRNVEKSSS